ncbi:MAG: glycosyltransferase [Chloroflexi bacterium]|nr:glycosyltransferase [Chloroflexota bacterium]
MFDQNLVFTTLLFFNWMVLAYFVGINIAYFGLLFISYFELLRYSRTIRHERWRRILQSPLTLPVSVIAPAYNEEVPIAESVRSLLMLQYPRMEVVVVNDGSRDSTMEVLIQSFGLVKVPTQVETTLNSKPIKDIYRSPDYPNLVVVDKENGGKADALNAGINVSRYGLVCAIDADSLIEGGALLRVVRPFLEKPRTTVAVGGIIRVVNGCDIEAGRLTKVRLPRSFLPMLQTVEYLRAFLFGRAGWSALRSLLIISGAFGVFKKETVIAVGGYKHNTVGEDMELVIRMHHHLRERNIKYDMFFLPDPVCWTEVPDSWKILGRQRNRWHRGLIDSLLNHRKMFMNPKYGTVGLLGMPYFTIFEMLGPIVEMSGYIVVPAAFIAGVIDLEFFIAFLSLAVLFGIVLSTGSLVLEELSFRRFPRAVDLLILLGAGVIENLGYRQINTLWRILAFRDFIRGNTAWGRMERKGFAKK